MAEIVSKPASPEYRSNWDVTFGGAPVPEPEPEQLGVNEATVNGLTDSLKMVCDKCDLYEDALNEIAHALDNIPDSNQAWRLICSSMVAVAAQALKKGRAL